MSLLKDEDVKKAIRASASSDEVIDVRSPAKNAAKQTLSMPYMAPKRQVTNMSLGQYGHQLGTNRYWGKLADNSSNSLVNTYLGNLISASISDVAKEDTIQSIDSKMYGTELESHANMSCMGRKALVVSDTGKVMEVNPFMPDYHAIKLRLVDAALKYDCPFTDKTYTMLVRNALHVPYMDHNLLPPFALKETGIRVNDTPKIHK
eukprot:3349630-Ditylum_brightwellii.AAC.1